MGGLSGLLGWTEAQREASRSEGFAGGATNIIKALAVLLVLDLAWFGYEVCVCVAKGGQAGLATLEHRGRAERLGLRKKAVDSAAPDSFRKLSVPTPSALQMATNSTVLSDLLGK